MTADEAFEQTNCIAECTFGAPVSLWAQYLPQWLMDAKFARKFRAAVVNGADKQHWTPEQREAAILHQIDLCLDMANA